MDEHKVPPGQEPDELPGVKAKPDQAEAPESVAPSGQAEPGDQDEPGAVASPAEETSQPGLPAEVEQPDPAGQPEPDQPETVNVVPSKMAEVQLASEAALAVTIFGADELAVFADRDAESAKSIEIPLVAAADPAEAEETDPAEAEEMAAGDEAKAAMPEPQEEAEPLADPVPDADGGVEPAEHIEPADPVEQAEPVEPATNEPENLIDPAPEQAEPEQAESEQPESSIEPDANQPGPLAETPESSGQPESGGCEAAAVETSAAAGTQPPAEDSAEEPAVADATAEAGNQSDEPVVAPDQEAEAQPGQMPPVEGGEVAAVPAEDSGSATIAAEPVEPVEAAPLLGSSLEGDASGQTAVAAEPAPASPAETAEPASPTVAGPKPEPAQAQAPVEVQVPAKLQPPAASESAGAAAKTRRVRKKSAWPRRMLLGAWVVLLVVILATVGWLGWLYVGTNELAANQAEKLRDEFWQACQNSPGDGVPTLEEDGGDQSPTTLQPATGVIALVSIPALGLQEWPVVAAEGGDPEELSGSVAWYPDSASPGEVGNTVISGYRITHGQPFAELLRLAAGDEVILETCLATHHYQIVVPASELTVDASEDWVIDAVPTDPGRLPSAPMITLITSQDLLPTSDRSVAFGKWISTTTR